jgi:D-alanyl-lipoteichoic acid acyltransferase DltB (MBOAT superfamily)
MSFESGSFLLLCLSTLLLYHLLAFNFRIQNVVLLVASWICYGWTNQIWLALLLGVTLFNFVVGILLDRSTGDARRKLLALGIVGNLSVLFVYKYFDFFTTNVAAVLTLAGLKVNPVLLSLALPIGISFHIFQLIAYLVDVARGNLKARRDIIVFACFVVYFPQVAAGPIERGHQILPQFERSRRISIDDIARALWLIISGTFMKVAVADPLAPIAAFGFDSGTSNAASLLVAILAFTVQIYADFCGYSLMAKGISGLFGIELVWNFERPYFSTSIRDFWHRWHISLSQWLRDYLYIPLGGNRISPARTEINLLTTMALGGLWHGAAWTFVAWGLLHGGALAVSRRIEDNRIVAAMPAWFGWTLTMLVVIAGWALFRMHSFQTIAALREFSWDTGHWRMLGLIAGLAAPVFLLESFQEVTRDNFVLLRLGPLPTALISGVLIAAIAVLYQAFQFPFIYFQF